MANTAYTLVVVIATVFILYMTKALMLPFVVAVLIWYFIKDIRDFLAQNRFFRDKLPKWLQNLMVFGLIFVVLSVVVRMLTSSIEDFSDKLPDYQQNIETVNQNLIEQYRFDLLAYIQKYTGNFDFTSLIEPVFNSLSQLFSNGFMIIIYVIFLMMEESTFAVKHRVFFRNPGKYVQSRALLHEIDASFSRYILIKTFTSLITATLGYLVLRFSSCGHPLLWASIIFLLNYIPNIGSLIATFFPAIIAVLQTGTVAAGLWVLVGVGTIQVLVGNFLEPKLMGDSLNISPLVVILSLVAWGAIWGILGMVLSVPIMVMFIIVCSKFEASRPIAILLSENGLINKPDHKKPLENERGEV
ncbi:MAG: AI-2E family transporter [Saprospiraceae bacterium]